MYLNYIFTSQRRRCRSENVEEEEGMLLKDQLLDHSDDDDDESENRAGGITIEDIDDEGIQPIHIGGHTASVQVRCCFLFCTFAPLHLYV